MSSLERRTVYFPANSLRVAIERQPNGEWTAIDADNWEPGMSVGWGDTELAAIADLAEQMREQEMA